MYFRYYAFLTIVFSICARDGYGDDGMGNKKCPINSSRNLLFVSTMDGFLTAIDILNNGKIAWSIDTGPNSLLSSSISKIELSDNGVKKHVVPSLDGLLYQLDKGKIQELPFNADTLLSSSISSFEDITIVGGKTSISMGVDFQTGKKLYSCDMNGCSHFEKDFKGDIISIGRQSKTVRCVDLKTARENWNFSVSTLDLSFVKSDRMEVTKLIGSGSDGKIEDPCNQKEDTPGASDDWFDFSLFYNDEISEEDIDLKFLISNGEIIAFDKRTYSDIIWKTTLSSDIASAWMWKDNKFTEIDLFREKYNPALDTPKENTETIFPQPTMYLGVYNDQVYIQLSKTPLDDVYDTDDENIERKQITSVSMPMVRWMPYLATADSRTALHMKYNHEENTLIDGDNESSIIWEYPFDEGFYLIPDTSPTHLQPHKLVDSVNFHFSLRYWWRELAALFVISTLITGVIIHAIIQKWFNGYNQLNSSSYQFEVLKVDVMSTENIVFKNETEKTSSFESIDKSSDRSIEDKKENYISRFYTDFEQEACLGKGGFGVVFQVRNKMDDCKYAIKRTRLIDSEKARARVLREVKALAKLDHFGIVRYYNTWFECPPPGWQDDIDQKNKTESYSGTTPCTLGETNSKLPKNEKYDDSYTYSKPKRHKIRNKHNTDDNMNDQDNPFRINNSILSYNDVSYASNTNTNTKKNYHNYDDSSSIIFTHSENTFDNINESYNYEASNEGMCLTNGQDSIIFEDSDDCKSISKSYQEISKSNELLHRRSHDKVSHNINICDNRSFHQFNKTDVSKSHHCDNESYKDDCYSKKKENDTPLKQKLYLYIQMQLCQRSTLRDWLSENTLRRDTHVLLEYFFQISNAVCYIHDQGMMHRDLKPSNIFFALDGTIKVGDFGLVAALEDHIDNIYKSSSPTHKSQKHTHQVGTKLYMSPEQSTGGNYSQKVDIYSLGLILFEMFFPFSTEMERINSLSNVRKCVFPARFIKELPKQHSLAKSMLQLNPDLRPSAKEILENDIFDEIDRLKILPIYDKQRSISSSDTSST